MTALFARVIDAVTSRGMGRALRYRYFLIMETVGWFSSTGLWFQRTAVGWLTWQLTESGAWLGAMVAAEAFPSILLTPFAGAVADRYDRLVMGRWVQLVLTLNTVLLASITILDLISIHVLFVIMLIQGVILAFWTPVRLAIVPSLVPRHDLAPAIAFHSVMFNLARFAGPAMAGGIIAIWGVAPAFVFNAIGYAAFLGALLYIELVYPETPTRQGRSLYGEVVEGVTYVFHHRGLRPFFAYMIIFEFLMRAVQELFPGFADVIFDRGAEGLGILLSATGFGAIFGSVFVGSFGKPRNVTLIMVVAIAITIALQTAFALTDVFWLGVVFAAALGAAVSAHGISGQIIVQSTVHGSMRGRAMGLWGMIIRAGPGGGALLLGWLSTFWGLQLPLIGAAAAALLIGLLLLPKFRVVNEEVKRGAEGDTKPPS